MRPGVIRSIVFLALLGGVRMPEARAAVPSVDSTHSSRHTVQQREFENGLQLMWEEDHRQPLVAIEARIKGGLRGEGRYIGAGITHFIEHMLFKGTPSRPPGTIDQEVRRYGGTINAFTSLDTTGVSLYVESKYLHEALGMLADILQHAVFEQSEFDKERAVIISEIQMNRDDPDRRLHQAFWGRHFLEHPYKHPIIGYQPLLEQLTVKDVQGFYASQYQPQNITIACVGDLTGADFEKTARELFGSWARGTTDPSQLLVPAEPPTASAKETSVELPVQTAYVMLGFSSTRLADPMLYPLDVLANILGQGRSSRLYEQVVRQRRLADEIAGWNYTPYDPGIFGIQLRTDPDKIPAATKAILEILEEIKQHGVTDAELRKAQRAVSASYVFSLQTIEAKAGDLANSMVSTGDPLFSRQYVTGVQQVTREQVQDAAKRFCDSSKMTTAVIVPQGQTPAAATATPAVTQMPVTRTVLGNGATTLVGVDRTLPMAAIVVAFRGGVRAESEETQGLSNLVAQLLTKGTARKDALTIAKQVESLGASLEPFSGRDGFGLILQLLSQDLNEGLALMPELVTQSTFPDEALSVQRGLIANQLKAQDDEIFDVGGRLLRRTLFGHHPYRFNPLGDPKILDRLTRRECLDFAKRWLVPSNLVVTVFGDLDSSAVAQTLQRSFGAMPAHASPWPNRLPEEPIEGVREATQTLEKEQALIMLGFYGTTQTDKDRDALDVMTAVLSGMAGRLFQAVREEHGLSYTLGAAHAPGWDPGYVLVYAATRPNEQQQVLKILDEQLQLAVDKGFTQEEVDQAKRYLIGAHRMDLQHLVGLAKRATLDELYGVGFDAWTTYENRINAVTVPMVNEAAQRYLTLGKRAQIVVSPNGHAAP
ncbi:MAG: insulinase family protein [Candidatus Omnitrophica bacterium]|nr:insulinase family protein [Candidatus Omnitrophota bacterium]